MSIQERFPSLGSSVDPEKLSLTIKGILGVACALAVYLGVVLPMTEVSPLIEKVGELVLQISAVISGIAALVGGIRKVVVSVKGK